MKIDDIPHTSRNQFLSFSSPNPTENVFLIPVFLYLLYVAFLLSYRITLHPLASFPGPKLAALTHLYEAYYDVFLPPGGQFIFHLDKLHNKFGPVIRISPEEIHVRDSDWYDVLYAGPGHRRDRWARSVRANGSPGSVASSGSHELHRARRGALNPFFSKRAITTLESTVRSNVQKLCDQITTFYLPKSEVASPSPPLLDLGTAFTAVTLDTIAEYCFNKSQKCLSEPDFAPRWKRFMTKLFDPAPIAKHFPVVMQTLSALPKWATLRLIPEFVSFFECQEAIHKQARAIWLEEEKAGRLEKSGGQGGERPRTIFHGILQSDLPLEEKSITRMSDEAFVLIGAGGETTARCLAFIFASLLQDKPLIERLRVEIDPVFVGNNGEIPDSRNLEELPLLKAVVQEGLRFSSPVTNRPIFIAPDEDLKCHEWIIPRGTPTSMTLGNALFDSKIFPSPELFSPDRWIDATKKGVRLDKYLTTFSKGNRSCVGMNLAMTELYLTVAALVVRFDMELYDFDFERDLKIVRDNFVGAPSLESRGVRARITARK